LVVLVLVRAGKRVIGNGHALPLYVWLVKCRFFFHYQYVMTSCNDYATMQLSILTLQCFMSMSESPIIHKCIHKENYHPPSLRPVRDPCLLLNASPLTWPFFVLVLVGDEQSLALALIENRFAALVR